jgi:hypothetical protein
MILPFVDKASAPTASVPLSCEIRTALSVKLDAPIPPCATGNAVSKVKEESAAEDPLTITFFQLAILFLLVRVYILYVKYKYHYVAKPR